MDMIKSLIALLNTGKLKEMTQMMGMQKKKKSRSMIWTPLIGLGLSAAAVMVNKFLSSKAAAPVQKAMQPVKNAMNKAPTTGAGGQIPAALLAEFASELDPKQKPGANKNKAPTPQVDQLMNALGDKNSGK